MIVDYLAANRARLGLEGRAVDERPAWVMVTPRFRASSHVIYLLLGAGATPALAVKVARLPGDGTSLDREAAHLRAVQATRPGGYDSIPRVVAYEQHCGHPILVETGVTGAPMDPALVRRDPARCCDALLAWLIGVQSNSRSFDPNWHARLVDSPLSRVAAVLASDPVDQRLLDDTHAAATQLRDLQLPLVFEHGDLSHPNVLLTRDGGVGVLDWETSQPAGLPACDLFFFLTYIAFARRARWSRQSHVDAFRDAFFGPSGWTRPYLERYADAIGLPVSSLLPLFLVGWVRYLAGVIERLGGMRAASESHVEATAAWLRANRFYVLWRYALTHADEVCWPS